MDGGREKTGSSSYSTSSSSSGTLSNAYTSSGSHLSSLIPMECGDDEFQKERERKIIILVQEFFGAPSATNGGNISVLKSWFTELGVEWVPHVASGASTEQLEHTLDARSWIRALAEIVETIRSTASLFPDRGSVGLPTMGCEEDEEPGAESCIPDQFMFARFTQETMLQMLAFVDAMAAPNPDTTGQDIVRGVVLASCEKLDALLDVRVALAKALSQIWLSSASPPSARVERVQREVASLLSAKEGTAGEAVWSTMEEVRTGILESMGDDSGTHQTRRGSSSIHRLTVYAMRYIRFLLANYSSVAPVVCEAVRVGKYVPRIGIGYVPPLSSLIVEMASCLEENLANKPEPFPDESLRLLFLLNNSYFIWQQVLPIWSSLEFNVLELHVAVTRTLEGYMERYLRVSWKPVSSCLFNPTPLCYRGGRASPLTKFESTFRKTYTAQKLWKVPDPELKKRLRKAITEEIMSAYTKYIEDNNVTTPKFAPRELEQMLQELFEG